MDTEKLLKAIQSCTLELTETSNKRIRQELWNRIKQEFERLFAIEEAAREVLIYAEGSGDEHNSIIDLRVAVYGEEEE